MLSIGEALESGAIGLVLSVVGTYLHSRRKGAEAIDAERRTQTEKAITERDAAIEQVKRHADTITGYKGQIVSLTNQLNEAKKPKRTHAEEHHHAEAKATLQKIGPAGAEILRHLFRVGSLAFGNIPPPLPTGMRPDSAQQMLARLSNEHHLVRYDMKHSGATISYVYEIAPGMRNALEALLFPAGEAGATASD